MVKYLLVFLLGLSQIVYGQNIPFLHQQHNSLGHVVYSDAPIWHYKNYTSELSYLQCAYIGIDYGDPYLLKGLQMQSVVVAMPFHSNTFALSFEHFGSEKWQETQWALSYAKRLAPYFSMGLKVDYYSIYQTEYYGNWHQLLFELSLSAEVTQQLNVASSLYNVAFQKFTEGFRLPVIYQVSASYRIEPNLILNLKIQKDLDNPMYYSAMVDFKLTQDLFIKTGIGIQPQNAFLGIAYRLKNLTCQILFTYQQNLGLRPYSHFDYVFKK